MPLIVFVKVVPSSGKSTCVLDKNDNLKCYLKSPPEKGKANKELIKLLATALSIAQQHVCLISGLTSRNKKVRIDLDITFEQLLEKLGIEFQQKLF